MFRYMMIGGSDNNVPSGFITKLFETCSRINPRGILFNGFKYENLELVITHMLKDIDVLFWFPNIDNSKEKIIQIIKKVKPSLILVSSKRNDNDKYSYHEIIAHGLKNKSNLMIIFSKIDDKVTSTIIDPLGNLFGKENTDYIHNVASHLIKRCSELTKFTRIQSVKISDTIPSISVDSKFIKIASNYAKKFHELIHTNNKDRFLGNLSFRCEGGFSSVRTEDGIYVSKRNIDKRNIGNYGFVKVQYNNVDNVVEYYGNSKPSVDTPIQLLLYTYFTRINYMIHSHTYFEWAHITTERKIPCGAIEEVYEIISHWPFPSDKTNFLKINLLGHGSIVMSNNIGSLTNLDYTARQIPEC